MTEGKQNFYTKWGNCRKRYR